MDPVEAVLSRMSLEERIAQRFIAWLRSENELKQMSEFVRTRRPGGIVVYPKNFTSYNRLAAVIDELTRAAGSGEPVALPFICTDQEGGRVSAFKFPETFGFPAPWYWARYDDPEFIRSAAYIQGRELGKLGFNMNLAPVLDLSGLPDGSVVGDRAMGGDPEKVARFARAYLNGLSAAGILAVAKHFPGHGVSGIDSHERLPVSEMTETELFSRDLVPFAAAVAHGVPIVMTGHILFPRIDPENPVTFSSYMIRTLLRGRLGFEGVVMSDALEMGAIAKGYRIEETLVRAIRAGVDLLLIGSLYDPARLISMVKDAVLSGELSGTEIDEGTRRILRLKYAAGLLPGAGG
jgi:beta-N-acetylhexosaminidase